MRRVGDPLMTATYGNSLHLRRHRPEDPGLRAQRLNWSFSPTLSLQAYLQPFISVGAYDRFKEAGAAAQQPVQYLR